jgi:hypothetical protein
MLVELVPPISIARARLGGLILIVLDDVSSVSPASLI